MSDVEDEPTVFAAGRWLRAVRRRAGLSQRELAARAGMAGSTVSGIESGRRVPRVSVFAHLVQASGCRLALVDADGTPIDLDDRHDAVRDRAGRRFPAHLDWDRLPDYLGLGRPWWGWEHLPWDVPGAVDLPRHVFWQRPRPPREGEWRDHPWWGPYQARITPRNNRSTRQSRPREGPPEPPPA